jgi:hypothetical protein
MITSPVGVRWICKVREENRRGFKRRGEEKRDLCLCLIKCKPLWALLVTQKSRIFQLHLGELKEIAKEEKSGRSNLYL